jgi:hypothetical protein
MVNLPQGTRLAVLIDAENISSTTIKQVLLRLQSYKGLILKRAYGDWSKSQLNGWKPLLLDWGIQPVHAPTYVAGKNSADMALTIDAMDLLHQQVNWFCIVSNDSDFTPLAHRLNSAGAKVVGFGTRQASRAFENACHRFIVIDDAPEPIDTVSSLIPEANNLATTSIATSVLPIENSPVEKLPSDNLSIPLTEASSVAQAQTAQKQAAKEQVAQKQTTQTTQKQTTQTTQKQTTQTTQKQTTQTTQKQTTQSKISRDKLGETLQKIFCKASANNNWLNLKTLHSQLQKQYPNFSCKQVGYSGLIKMIEGAGRFEIRQRQPNAQQPNQKIVEIRLKKAA